MAGLTHLNSKLQKILASEPGRHAIRWIAINTLLATIFELILSSKFDYPIWVSIFVLFSFVLFALNIVCAWFARGPWRWVFLITGLIVITFSNLIGRMNVTNILIYLPSIARSFINYFTAS
jgi:hypothetical protein